MALPSKYHMRIILISQPFCGYSFKYAAFCPTLSDGSSALYAKERKWEYFDEHIIYTKIVQRASTFHSHKYLQSSTRNIQHCARNPSAIRARSLSQCNRFIFDAEYQWSRATRFRSPLCPFTMLRFSYSSSRIRRYRRKCRQVPRLRFTLVDRQTLCGRLLHICLLHTLGTSASMTLQR